jgi:hypothetical protein
MSTRNLPGGKGGLAREADNLTATLDISQRYGLPQPVTGITLPFLTILDNPFIKTVIKEE